MECGICIAADRNWDPQYLRDPGKLCETHERALDRLVGMMPLARAVGGDLVVRSLDADAEA